MKYFLAAFLALGLAACGGGGDDATVAVVAEDVTVNVNPTTAAAVVDEPFVFPSGVPGLGTTGTTTVVFTSTATAPAFSISADGGTATGTTTFGSCIFAVTRSTFPAGHPMALGQTVTVNPCAVSMAVSNAVANGQSIPRSIALLLGAAASAKTSATVAVTPDGRLVLNGANVTTVGLTFVTGGGS